MVSGIQAIKYITYLALSQAAHQENLSNLNSCPPLFNRIAAAFNRPIDCLHFQLLTCIFPVRHSQPVDRHPGPSGHPSIAPFDCGLYRPFGHSIIDPDSTPYDSSDPA
jgi:hypothetical protein